MPTAVLNLLPSNTVHADAFSGKLLHIQHVLTNQVCASTCRREHPVNFLTNHEAMEQAKASARITLLRGHCWLVSTLLEHVAAFAVRITET